MIANPRPSQPTWIMNPPEKAAVIRIHHRHLLLLIPRGDTHFTVPRRMEGWVDLGTAVRVCSLCPRLYIAVAVVINTAARGEIWIWVLSHRSQACCVMKRSRWSLPLRDTKSCLEKGVIKVPPKRVKRISRFFCAAAPTFRNSLPDSIGSSVSIRWTDWARKGVSKSWGQLHRKSENRKMRLVWWTCKRSEEEHDLRNTFD